MFDERGWLVFSVVKSNDFRGDINRLEVYGCALNWLMSIIDCANALWAMLS